MRIFFRDNTNVQEITKEINSYKSDTYITSITTSDAIYLASDFPLNHFYIKMGSVLNTANATMNISYWSASGWANAVNVNDYTYGLTMSGFVEFTPDRDESWLYSDTNSGGNTIDELTSIKVYDKYWTKISFNIDLDPDIEMEWIGSLFSSDEDLFSEYPIFNDATFLTAFEAGKTTWQEQHVKAADLIIQDLKRKNVILGKEQLLDREILIPAAVCKAAEIIFNSFGNDYADQKDKARLEYVQRIDLSKYLVDNNNNGIVDRVDVIKQQGWLSR